jgi:hypothetical protein
MNEYRISIESLAELLSTALVIECPLAYAYESACEVQQWND